MEHSDTEQNDNQPVSGRFFLSRLLPLLAKPRAHFLFFSFLLGSLILDLWSKYAVFEWLRYRGSVTFIDGFFQFVMAENSGAAFGIAAGQRGLLVAASIIALLMVLVIFLFSGKEPTLMHITLGLFAGGVCGNLYDRLFNDGRVRDFIDVVYWPGKHWPAFNVADSVLCISVTILVLSYFRQQKKSS